MSHARATWASVAVVVVGLLHGCDLDVEGAYKAYCQANPQACDGGTSDAGSVGDAGGADAGGTDAGSGDAGTPDAAGFDAGAPDGGQSDGGGSDGGGGDAGARDGGGTDAGPLDAGLPLAAWCDAVARAQCDRALRCGVSQAVTCAALVRSTCVRNELPRARAGSLRYDPFAAQACVQRVSALPCGNASATCPDVLLPGAGLGQRCEDNDCAAGYCPYVARNTPTLDCPRCTPYLDAGESCVATSGPVRPCPQGTVCDGATCVALRADGAPCTTNGDCRSSLCTNPAQFDGGVERCGAFPRGAPCVDSFSCGPGAYCAGLRFTTSGVLNVGSCQPRRALGQPCPDEQEDEGCLTGTCVASTCQALAATQPTGAPCDLSSQCAVGRCTRSFFLPNGNPSVDDGACVVAAIGEACIGSSDCVQGAYCAGDGGCARPADAGAPCELGGCGVLVCLAAADGGRVCGLPASRGESCATVPCDNGSTCITQDGGARICGWFPLGATCPGPPRCESYRCANDGGGSTCAASCF